MNFLYINIHTHYFNLVENVFSIVNVYPQQNNPENFYFSVGIHPWHLQKQTVETHFLLLQKKMKNPKCIAIGECGLDKNASANLSLQFTVFKKQISFSEVYEKPLLIHCVKAHNELIKLKKEIQPSQIWILHGFNKRPQIAKQLLDAGILISFGKALLTNTSTQKSFIETPFPFLFLETDDETISIQEIYKKAAELKQISIKELIVHLHSNFKKYFLQNGKLVGKNNLTD